jgi:hypothetical protein
LQKDGDFNFVFNLKKKNNQQITESNNKNNGGVSEYGIRNQRIHDTDLDMEIKNSQNYLFNSKKFFKKNKDSTKINDSDIILKNEELKEEFLNENNLILDSYKGNKYLQSKNSNYETSNTKIDFTLEMRRMMIELIK